VIYRETHTLLKEITDASIDGTRKEHMELLATVPLLIIDDLCMRKLAPTAAEELLEIIENQRLLRTKDPSQDDFMEGICIPSDSRLFGWIPRREKLSDRSGAPSPWLMQ
jgi:hypothetical protein